MAAVCRSGWKWGWREAGRDPGEAWGRGGSTLKTKMTAGAPASKQKASQKCWGGNTTTWYYGSIDLETIWKKTWERGRGAGEGRHSLIMVLAPGDKSWPQRQKWWHRCGGLWGYGQQAGGARPPTPASQEGFCLSGWLICSGEGVTFIDLTKVPRGWAFQGCVLVFVRAKPAE